MSKITVTTIAGQTSGSDANLVKIESGDTLQALSNATVGGTLGVTGTSTLSGNATVGGTLGVTGTLTSNGVSNLIGSATHGTDAGDTRFILTGPNQYRAVFKQGGNIAGQLGGAGTDDLIFSNAAGATTMQIKDGRVTIPNQPSFRASPSGSVNLTSAGDIVFADVSGNPDFNTGSHYNTSNGRFTAPVAGTYLFCFSGYKQTSQSGGDINIRINGTNSGEVRLFNSNSSHETMEGTFIFKLSASDYVNLHSELTYLHLNPTMSHFSGYLLG